MVTTWRKQHLVNSRRKYIIPRKIQRPTQIFFFFSACIDVSTVAKVLHWEGYWTEHTGKTPTLFCMFPWAKGTCYGSEVKIENMRQNSSRNLLWVKYWSQRDGPWTFIFVNPSAMGLCKILLSVSLISSVIYTCADFQSELLGKDDIQRHLQLKTWRWRRIRRRRLKAFGPVLPAVSARALL